MERLALVSDLDGTLIGDDASLRTFASWHSQVRDCVRLVYSSGRFLTSIRHSIEVFQLPRPDAIICGVGTEIFDSHVGSMLSDWPAIDGGWDPEVVKETCLQEPGLELQPVSQLSPFKISLYGYDLAAERIERLKQRLESKGQHVSLVYSSNRDLDILPHGIDKGSAAAHLIRRWNLRSDSTIVAGDSGNDLAMFRHGFRGIVVGNAQHELLSLAGPKVYRATRHFAAGVIEGLKHWRHDLWEGPVKVDRSSGGRGVDRGTRG